MPSYDFAEMHRRTQENLITFLRAEVDLAGTFRAIADRTDNPEHREKLLHDIQKAVSAIRHLGERITDRSIRKELSAAADDLDEFVSRRPEHPKAF